jgi:LysM repeat protein
MDSIKTAIVVTVLLVVGYVVYQQIQNNSSTAPPSDVADGFPNVDLPKPGNNATAGKNASPWNRQTAGQGSSGPSPFEVPASIPGEPRGSDRAGGLAAPFPTSGPRDSGGNEPRAPEGRGRLTADRSPPSSSPNPTSTEVRRMFRDALDDARRRLPRADEHTLADVHLQLSRLYGNPGLSGDEARELAELLDQLAGMVIYSRQHILEPPYTTRAGDSLRTIAQSYNIPYQLLAKINGIRDPDNLEPGRQLKVVRGPFDAVISLDRYELVLMLAGYYAGRFPIGIGRDQPRLEGNYAVRNKTTQPRYDGPQGTVVGGDPRNPLGKYWIGLDGPLGIHGTSDLKNLRRNDNLGTICLGDRDIEDVYDILSAESQYAKGSRVTIQR